MVSRCLATRATKVRTLVYHRYYRPGSLMTLALTGSLMTRLIFKHEHASCDFMVLKTEPKCSETTYFFLYRDLLEIPRDLRLKHTFDPPVWSGSLMATFRRTITVDVPRYPPRSRLDSIAVQSQCLLSLYHRRLSTIYQGL